MPIIRRIVPVAVAAVFLLAVSVAPNVQMSPVRAASSTTDTLTVSTGTVTRVLPLSGSVASLSQASIVYSGPSTTVATVDVKTGQSVTGGQVLATMADGATLTAPLSGTVVGVGLQTGTLVPTSTSASSGTVVGGVSAAVSGQGSGGRGGAGGGPGGGAQQSQTISAKAESDAITVADTTKLDVVASVSETNVHLLKVGQAVRLVVPGEPGVIYNGRVTSISYTANPSSSSGVTYPVSISLTPPDGAPLPWLGMTVQAYVTVATQTGVVIPVAAVHQNASGQYAVRLPDGTERLVTLGIAGVNQVIVLTGLSPGTLIEVPPDAQPAKTVTVIP